MKGGRGVAQARPLANTLSERHVSGGPPQGSCQRHGIQGFPEEWKQLLGLWPFAELSAPLQNLRLGNPQGWGGGGAEELNVGNPQGRVGV